MTDQYERELGEAFMAEQDQLRLNPQNTMAAGYSAATSNRRTEKVADTFSYSDQYERIIAIRDNEPHNYVKVGQILRIGLGHYLEAKEAAQQAGRYVGPPDV